MENKQRPQPERQKATVWGALIADAAALGVHWIYAPQRIREIADKYPEFLEPKQAHYDGVKGYFAHGNRTAGDQTQYGEQILVMLETLAANGGEFELADYQRIWHGRFAEGVFDGYRDVAIKETLKKLDAGTQGNGNEAELYSTPQGADDDQMPALAKLAPLVAARANADSLLDEAEAAVRATNNNATAVAYGRFATVLLQQVLLSCDLDSALDAALEGASSEVRKAVEHARKAKGADPVAYTETVGMDCHLDHGVPCLIQNLLGAQSFADAIRRNIYSGGDSAGRGAYLGALAGAYFSMDAGDGIPPDWIEKLHCREQVEAWMKPAFPQI
ncbi:MAG: ADP-ribosylglycohydrolase family protein [Verrucomicrobiota bacterium JB022]|nr:ADP-ribosylglycohydrolase family protein [Verrucomicrobiota bacterium JB022]